MAFKEHIRCPVCGKLSVADLFNALKLGGHHKLEVMRQHFVGRYHGGFRWEGVDKSKDKKHILGLMETLRLAYQWLSSQLGEESEDIELCLKVEHQRESLIPKGVRSELIPIEVKLSVKPARWSGALILKRKRSALIPASVRQDS